METKQPHHHVVIFVKGPLVGAAGIWSNGHRHFVGSCDPRCKPPVHKREYTRLADARQSFADHIKITTDRGWTIAYSGPPNVG